MKFCSIYPIDPIFSFWGKWGMLDFYFLPIVFPSTSQYVVIKFLMGFRHVAQISKVSPQHVLNSSSLCPICFAQHYPFGTYIGN